MVDGNLAINAGTDDLGIQCTSGATITNNIVINASKSNIVSTTMYVSLLMFLELAGIGVIQNSMYPVVNAIRNVTINHNTVYMSQSDACLRLNGVTNKNITILNNVFYCGSQLSIKATADLTGKIHLNNPTITHDMKPITSLCSL